MSQLLLRIGGKDDVDDIVELLNTCYRSQEGWTNEASIIAGERVRTECVYSILKNPKNYCFVFDNNGLSESNRHLLGCIIVQLNMHNSERYAVIQMAAVCPSVQQRGIGGEMLQAVEVFAKEHLKQGKIVMDIPENREELIAHYQRRGYHHTGVRKPISPQEYGQPYAHGIEMIELEKKL